GGARGLWWGGCGPAVRGAPCRRGSTGWPGLLERERSLASSMRAALIYPAVLVIAAIGSIVLLLDYVLPQFAPIFEQAGAELPAATRLLMALGAAAGAATPWLLLGLLAAGLIARHLLARPAYRLKLDRLLLRLPVAGQL